MRCAPQPCKACTRCALVLTCSTQTPRVTTSSKGELIDTKARRNLTEDRINKLTAVEFSELPLKDAFTIVRGDGKRKVAVFEDPNCGYCKRFERDLQNVDNVTIYLFLYPILSPDSAEKSRNVWCAKDRVVAWQDMMVRDKEPAATPAATRPPSSATWPLAASTRSPAPRR